LVTRIFITMSSDEDERDSAIGYRQPPLQIKTTHARHPHVDDQAGRAWPMLGMQKIFPRGKHLRPIPC
jgi:hypothetical protein